MPFAADIIHSTGNKVFNLLGETGKRSHCLRNSAVSIFTKKGWHTKDYFMKIFT